MIDILLLAIVGVVTWCVASEGAWGAVFTCLSAILAGLLAMNFFEPLSISLQGSIASSPEWSQRWDIIALVGLFAVCTGLLRAATLYLSPTFITTSGWAHEGVRWSAAFLTGYVTMAFLLTALHTAPLPREFLGFRAERKNLGNVVAPDRQWLAFTQYVSMNSLSRTGNPKIFDGQQIAVPEGSGDVAMWPSFPIRYAHRREHGASMVSSTAAPQVRTIERNTPAGGGPGRGGGTNPGF